MGHLGFHIWNVLRANEMLWFGKRGVHVLANFEAYR